MRFAHLHPSAKTGQICGIRRRCGLRPLRHSKIPFYERGPSGAKSLGIYWLCTGTTEVMPSYKIWVSPQACFFAGCEVVPLQNTACRYLRVCAKGFATGGCLRLSTDSETLSVLLLWAGIVKHPGGYEDASICDGFDRIYRFGSGSGADWCGT